MTAQDDISERVKPNMPSDQVPRRRLQLLWLRLWLNASAQGIVALLALLMLIGTVVIPTPMIYLAYAKAD